MTFLRTEPVARFPRTELTVDDNVVAGGQWFTVVGRKQIGDYLYLEVTSPSKAGWIPIDDVQVALFKVPPRPVGD